MPKLCLLKTAKAKVTGSERLKEAITDAYNFDNVINGFFQDASRINKNFKSNLKKLYSKYKIETMLLVFSGRGFQAIGNSTIFTSTRNDPDVLAYPEAICVLEDTFASYGYSDNEIDQLVRTFQLIKQIYKDEEGVLPLYKLEINTEALEQHDFFHLKPEQLVETIVQSVE